MREFDLVDKLELLAIESAADLMEPIEGYLLRALPAESNVAKLINAQLDLRRRCRALSDHWSDKLSDRLIECYLQSMHAKGAMQENQEKRALLGTSFPSKGEIPSFETKPQVAFSFENFIELISEIMDCNCRNAFLETFFEIYHTTSFLQEGQVISQQLQQLLKQEIPLYEGLTKGCLQKYLSFQELISALTEKMLKLTQSDDQEAFVKWYRFDVSLQELLETAPEPRVDLTPDVNETTAEVDFNFPSDEEASETMVSSGSPPLVFSFEKTSSLLTFVHPDPVRDSSSPTLSESLNATKIAHRK